jgi:hypothetical protein
MPEVEPVTSAVFPFSIATLNYESAAPGRIVVSGFAASHLAEIAGMWDGSCCGATSKFQPASRFRDSTGPLSRLQ